MSVREGSLEAPTRHPLNWQDEKFYDKDDLYHELERVYDICHGCRRCISLCNSFPTLFDLVDESDTMEVDGVKKEDYWKVVDHCYLCDLCFLTKCPYVPPHEWDLDFPHLMLRAKAVQFREQGASFRNKTITNTDMIGKFAGIPIMAGVVNAVNKNKTARKLLETTFGIDARAKLPQYHSKTLRKRIKPQDAPGEAAGPTKGRVALFATCYGNYNDPTSGEDLKAVFEHNGIPVTLFNKEQCCGMPKLELGDLESVAKAKEVNIPQMAKMIDEGWDIVGPVPSCVLMFKQELPLMFPHDADVAKVAAGIFDPFEYLMLRHKYGKLNTDFKNPLGKVSWHVACHQRVQRIGQKTRELMELIPDTSVEPIERCSGHDGTYALKKEFHDVSMKIVRPVANKVKQAEPDHYTSDCVMAAQHISNALGDQGEPEHPISLIRKAYGI